MSDIIWCDIGGHAFSANDPKRKFWAQPGNEYGTNQLQARLDACGDHADFQVKLEMPSTAPQPKSLKE